LETFQGILKAFPDSLKLNHVLNTPGTPTRDLGTCSVTNGRLDLQILSQLTGWENDPHSKLAIVSGPTQFNSDVTDYLMELGASNQEIRILDADRFVEF
jgi:hypothetical protein